MTQPPNNAAGRTHHLQATNGARCFPAPLRQRLLGNALPSMKNKYIVWLPLLLLLLNIIMGIGCATPSASPPPHKNSYVGPTNVLGYLERVRTALKKNTAAANMTDQEMNFLMNESVKTNLAAELWARSAVYNLRSAKSGNIVLGILLLEDLRAGRTNEAMRSLEAHLDDDVVGLGTILDAASSMGMPIESNNLESLGMAKDYWLKFPRARDDRNLDSGVKHALSLVDKK
jgi:hypothetical protein